MCVTAVLAYVCVYCLCEHKCVCGVCVSVLMYYGGWCVWVCLGKERLQRQIVLNVVRVFVVGDSSRLEVVLLPRGCYTV